MITNQTEQQSPPLTTGKRRMVLLACILAIFMSAIEATIIATAMPTIITELGGFALMSWVFSAYLLTQAISVPIYGRLSDLYGRKKLFFIGIILFLTGSILCGFANDMFWLIVFRLLQGMGAGGIVPVASTVIGDIYTPQERPKVQGYLSSIWAFSAIVGPLVGAFIVQNYHWALIFWLNIPLGLLAIFTLHRYLPEHRSTHRPKLDIKGALYLTLAVASLLIGLLQWMWLGIWVVPLLIVALLAGYQLIQQEKQCAEPLFPLTLWHNKIVLAANLGGLFVGAAMMGLTVFLPTFIQGVMGLSAFEAGATLAFISIGWPLASTLAGFLMLKTSYRFTAALGSFLLIFGCLFLLTLTINSPLLQYRIAALLIGAGMGLSTTTYLIAVQNSVSYEIRGIATASTIFTRLLGSAVGAAILGFVLNISLIYYLPDVVDPVQILMQPTLRLGIDATLLQSLINHVTSGLFIVFLVATLFSLMTIITCIQIPAKIKPSNNPQH